MLGPHSGSGVYWWGVVLGSMNARTLRVLEWGIWDGFIRHFSLTDFVWNMVLFLTTTVPGFYHTLAPTHLESTDPKLCQHGAKMAGTTS